MKARERIDEEKYVKAVEQAGVWPAYDHEVAGVVAMLCSEDGSWSTESVVCANGGLNSRIESARDANSTYGQNGKL